jgi:hypothetical protein
VGAFAETFFHLSVPFFFTHLSLPYLAVVLTLPLFGHFAPTFNALGVMVGAADDADAPSATVPPAATNKLAVAIEITRFIETPIVTERVVAERNCAKVRRKHRSGPDFGGSQCGLRC